MARATLAHGSDEYEVTFFPRQFAKVDPETLLIGNGLMVLGSADAEPGRVIANEWTTLDALKEALDAEVSS
jgi:hypothetical protein